MREKPKNIKQYVGIDVAKGHLDIFIYPDGLSQRIDNNANDISLLAKNVLAVHDIASITLESTGGYENVAMSILEQQWRVTRAHPNYVHNFSKALGKRAKTDQIDAKIIAQYGQFTEAECRDKITVDRVLHALVTRRDQLKELAHAEKCRLPKTSEILVNQSITAVIALLETQILALGVSIEEHIAASPESAHKKALICSFKGAGKATAASLLAYLPELGTLNKKQIAALVGVAPYNHDSGTKTGKRFIHGGRQNVRNALYMTALVAMRHNKIMKAFYDKLKAAGKPSKLALTAVIRKIIVILNTMIKFNEKWKFADAC